VISFPIAKEKDICQACLNDLKFGLPVGVRDTVVAENQRKRKLAEASLPSLPSSSSGYQYSQELTNPFLTGSEETQEFLKEKDNLVASRQLQQFSKASSTSTSNSNSTAFRNLPKLCTFWLNNQCRRVETGRCPFRPCCGVFVFPEIAGSHRELHEQLKTRLAAEGPMKVQKSLDVETKSALQQALKGNKDEAIRKKVAGEDDLSKKYLNKMKSMDLQLQAPSDPTITTLYLGNIDATISEADIAGVIYPFGQYTSIRIIRSSNCAFIDYIDRNNAEYAASNMYNALLIHGKQISVSWAKGPKTTQAGSTGNQFLVPHSNPYIPIPVQYPSYAYLPPPPGMAHVPVHMYALPNMPLPTAHGPHTSSQGNMKRQKVEK